MFEFTVAFATSMVAGYALLARRYAIRSIGFLPLGVALALLLYASSLPREISQLVPALQNPPLLTIHVGMAVLSYGIFATSFAAGVAYLAQGPTDRFSWLPSHKVLDEVAYRAVIIGFPIFATMIILGLVVGLDRVVALLGLGPQGDGRPRHVADLCGLPARAEPALMGGSTGGAAAGRRLRHGPRHVFGVALVLGPARV